MRTMWRGRLAILAMLAFFAPAAVAQTQNDGQPIKQIKLTDKQVQNFISAQKQLAPLASKLEAAGDKPDPELQSQLEKIAKGAGFSSLDDFDDVAANVSLVLSGLDPKTGQFTEPPEQIKKDMEEVRQDKQMPQKDKEQVLAEMQEALKTAAPLQFKENVAVVKKFQKELDQLAPRETPAKK